jgi:hypothetical protein
MQGSYWLQVDLDLKAIPLGSERKGVAHCLKMGLLKEGLILLVGTIDLL